MSNENLNESKRDEKYEQSSLIRAKKRERIKCDFLCKRNEFIKKILMYESQQKKKH